MAPTGEALNPATHPPTHPTRAPPQVPGHALGACKEAINKAAGDALLAYRTHCAAASSSGQLILPEALKLLPLYTLALSKHTVFRADSRPDVRAAAMWRLLSLPAHKAVPLLYARMVRLDGLLDRPEVRCWLLLGGWSGAGRTSGAAALSPQRRCSAAAPPATCSPVARRVHPRIRPLPRPARRTRRACRTSCG